MLKDKKQAQKPPDQKRKRNVQLKEKRRLQHKLRRQNLRFIQSNAHPAR